MRVTETRCNAAILVECVAGGVCRCSSLYYISPFLYIPIHTNAHCLPLSISYSPPLVATTIAGMFSTLEYTPIHFINRPVDQVELAALYSVADSVVVSSVRDGMNLVSHEYVDGRRRSRR